MLQLTLMLIDHLSYTEKNLNTVFKQYSKLVTGTQICFEKYLSHEDF